ncbi:MAG: succinate dehydrogenase assembly factor 2 [Methylococcaceae bacterium]|jgi:antitoxin CptB|nr:succinate dehydrogenase assembly factor 2 [Methylococcaceae bacterium]
MNRLARLRWQCRRGTKELDLLLQRYLETGYLPADGEEKALFIKLLELEDDELLGVLMGELGVKMGEMKLLVEKIRAFAAARV